MVSRCSPASSDIPTVLNGIGYSKRFMENCDFFDKNTDKYPNKLSVYFPQGQVAGTMGSELGIEGSEITTFIDGFRIREANNSTFKIGGKIENTAYGMEDGVQYSIIAIGRQEPPKPFAGLEYVTKISASAGYDNAITNDGNLVMKVSNSSTPPIVYDISSGTAVESSYSLPSTVTLSSIQFCDFSYDDELAVIGGLCYNPKSNKGAHWWNVADGTYVGKLTATNNRIVCANNHRWVAYQTSSAPYTVTISDLDAKANVTTTTTTFSSITRLSFSPDDQYIAVCSDLTISGYTYGAMILKVGDGTRVATPRSDVAVSNVSWSAGGKRLALILNAAPWIEIYDTSSWTKICDLGEHFTAQPYADFLAESNVLVAGSDTTVKAFEFKDDSTFEEITNIPAYNGGTIKQIRSSKNGKNILVGGSSGIEVWKLKE
jgi:hypothetical protein